MNIAIPLNHNLSFYHDNPITAPQFAIYYIDRDSKKNHIHTSLDFIAANPLNIINQGKYSASQIKCVCEVEKCSDIHHISEHYLLLESINGCEYLLADHYCNNIQRALINGGISIYKIPPFIHKPDNAIKNFLLGALFASTTKQIHYAS
ncbi:MAG TPA: hypothetical protein ENK98_02915 [Epsilonproteobacteria bacterium]|nr:hypothetical protein [Campylobacterota bacterium]